MLEPRTRARALSLLLAVLFFSATILHAQQPASTPTAPPPTPAAQNSPPPAVDAGQNAGQGTAGGAQAGDGQVQVLPGATYWYAAPPLTARQKMSRSLSAAFLSPRGYIFSAASAAVTEARERDQPQKTPGDRAADGLSRFARNFATRSTATLLGAGLYPVIFKQDPRYHPSIRKGFGPRTLHAASRVFVTYDDRGRSVPNYSQLLGSLSSSAIANLYERSTPGYDRIGAGPTFQRFGASLAFEMLTNIIFKEFGPDIKKIFKH